jgi:hypothetical protein
MLLHLVWGVVKAIMPIQAIVRILVVVLRDEARAQLGRSDVELL